MTNLINNFIHNFFIHPVCACLPVKYAERLHTWHVIKISPINHWSLNKELTHDSFVLFNQSRSKLLQFLNDDVGMTDSDYKPFDITNTEEISSFIDFLYTYLDGELDMAFESYYRDQFEEWLINHHTHHKLLNT